MYKKILAFGLLALMLTACTTNEFYETVVDPEVQQVVINQGNRTLMVGRTFQFTATVTTVGGADAGVNWLVGDYSLATIDQNGTVTGLSVGTTTVTAVSRHDPEQTTSVTLTIIRAPAVDSVTLNLDELALRPGQTSTLVATVTAVSGATTAVTWTSSDPTVATISSSGVVTTVSGGTAVITVRSVFDNAVFDTITVYVQQVVSLETSPTDLTFTVGDDAETLTTTVTVLGNAPTTVVYASTNPAVATVSQLGVVTPVAEGTAFVVVTSTFDSTFFTVIPVTVEAPVP